MVQMRSFQSDEARWRALRVKDERADGQFVYAVRTTGVFCRPNCAARLALRENIVFFSSCEEAEQSGFRACKRCQPKGESQNERETEAANRACRLIQEADGLVRLAELADAVGLSRFHFQRVFKKVVGVSPRQYAMALRDQRAREELKRGGSVTQAVYAAGYNASSRFYERSSRALGMKPWEYRANGNGLKIRYAIVKSALGLVLVAGTERGICCVHFGESRSELEQHLNENFARAEVVQGDAQFKSWVKVVVARIDGKTTGSKLPLDVRGTAFQHRVWNALNGIPKGTTSTYAKLATQLGKPSAVRAVARACATNPVAVVVPCHRVVRSDGELAGYRWGLERKRRLLKREGTRE
jgi:AraC family transcriptional regulator, regulatory protein of adaptative response / methylated-DNA-[protein]-cysteine methyltransferase